MTMLGKHHSKETKRKIALNNSGLFKKGQASWNKGKKGFPAYWKGKKMSKEACEKMKKADRTLTSGENHYNWKGGITSLVMRIRNSEEYKIWRESIFKRDNFICVLCKESGYINADNYPKSFSQILKENNIKTFKEALNCKELWDIFNGRTLCIDCHKKTETYCKRINK